MPSSNTGRYPSIRLWLPWVQRVELLGSSVALRYLAFRIVVAMDMTTARSFIKQTMHLFRLCANAT